MNLYIDCDNSVSISLRKVFYIFSDPRKVNIVKRRSEADLVIVDSEKKLFSDYLENQRYVIVSSKKIKDLPSNTRWIFVRSPSID